VSGTQQPIGIGSYGCHGPAFWQVRVLFNESFLVWPRVPMKVVDEKHPWSDVRMGRRGGEMDLAPQDCAVCARLLPIAVAGSSFIS
jgi:hypothetical protein